ncbi:hypothetical protein [Pilimelia anulata]|uniref:hypothetical protein n=1 Tax=Pilimelia anulata TaxID=53371 RepID=UPI0016667984|nr:hypothetical protein [Pilimelia anulata]
MAMPDMYNDPSGNTAQFRAFAATPAPAPEKKSPVGLFVGVGVAAVVVIGLIVWALV